MLTCIFRCMDTDSAGFHSLPFQALGAIFPKGTTGKPISSFVRVLFVSQPHKCLAAFEADDLLFSSKLPQGSRGKAPLERGAPAKPVRGRMSAHYQAAGERR
jgi:hypothetical protein